MTEQSAMPSGEVVHCPDCGAPMVATLFLKETVEADHLCFSCQSSCCAMARPPRKFWVRTAAEITREWLVLKAAIRKQDQADARSNQLNNLSTSMGS